MLEYWYNERGLLNEAFTLLVPDGAPPNVTARNLSSTELLVEWNPLPENYIHGALLGYQMKFTRDKTNVTKVLNILPNITNYHVTGLERYARYVISLAAVNEVGVGVYSDDVVVWTDEGGKLCLILSIFAINITQAPIKFI